MPIDIVELIYKRSHDDLMPLKREYIVQYFEIGGQELPDNVRLMISAYEREILFNL